MSLIGIAEGIRFLFFFSGSLTDSSRGPARSDAVPAEISSA